MSLCAVYGILNWGYGVYKLYLAETLRGGKYDPAGFRGYVDFPTDTPITITLQPYELDIIMQCLDNTQRNMVCAGTLTNRKKITKRMLAFVYRNIQRQLLAKRG